MKPEVYLVIEKGEPYRANTILELTNKEYIIGRNSQQLIPDIAFSSAYISRKHAIISKNRHGVTIADLSSKHGTEVDGIAIEQTPHALRDGATIVLARGEVVLQYHNCWEKEQEYTKEFVIPPEWKEKMDKGLMIHPERREVCVDGRPLFLSGKDIELLLLLFRHVNQAVSYEMIKAQVWPERLTDAKELIPDVGENEISVLVYRLRKKLGKYGNCIITIPRYGYMLDM